MSANLGGEGGGGIGPQEEPSFWRAVSWAPNPNGADVMGSSIWSGRPESIEKGPYQEGRAVEDAEQELLDGFRRGQYSAWDVVENIMWAERVGIPVSNQAWETMETFVKEAEWRVRLSLKTQQEIQDRYKMGELSAEAVGEEVANAIHWGWIPPHLGEEAVINILSLKPLPKLTREPPSTRNESVAAFLGTTGAGVPRWDLEILLRSGDYSNEELKEKLKEAVRLEIITPDEAKNAFKNIVIEKTKRLSVGYLFLLNAITKSKQGK